MSFLFNKSGLGWSTFISSRFTSKPWQSDVAWLRGAELEICFRPMQRPTPSLRRSVLPDESELRLVPLLVESDTQTGSKWGQNTNAMQEREGPSRYLSTNLPEHSTIPSCDFSFPPGEQAMYFYAGYPTCPQSSDDLSNQGSGTDSHSQANCSCDRPYNED